MEGFWDCVRYSEFPLFHPRVIKMYRVSELEFCDVSFKLGKML